MIRAYLLLSLMIFITSGCTRSNQLQKLSVGSVTSPPQTVTFVIKNYVPQSGNIYQNLFVSNFSVKVKNGQLLPSTSRDGFSDQDKLALASTYGFTLNSTESAVSGFADLFLYDLGIATSQQNLMYCASNLLLSSSNDALVYNDDRVSPAQQELLGLRDCEKVYLGLDPSLFDSAGNGIPDYMKLRCGINMLSKNAAYISTAGDGMSDLEKCKRNIPLDESSTTEANQLFAYQYSIISNTDGTTDLEIANVPILNGGDENFVAFYLTELNSSTSAPTLSTAYAVLKPNSNGKRIEIPYWATSSSNLFNQEILLP